MLKRVQIGLMLVLMIAVIGCDAAKDAADKAKDAGNKAADAAKDMADIDFGDFKMGELKDKFSGITSGLKDVSADSVGGLVTKIKELTGSMDGMGFDKLTGPAKTAAGTAVSGFMETVKKAMGGISDEGILAKLKPVIDALMDKLKGMAG